MNQIRWQWVREHDSIADLSTDQRNAAVLLRTQMPKHFIRRIIPDHHTIRNHQRLRIFGRLLHDPNLWHLNRRSASGAFAVGLFMAFVPVPFQMFMAAAAAIVFRVNLPLAVALVWVTNPVTIPPIFYFAYLVGSWILRGDAVSLHFELSAAALEQGLGEIWAPLVLGSFVCAVVSATIGYFVVRGLWRWHLVKHIRQRRAARANRTKVEPGRGPA